MRTRVRPFAVAGAIVAVFEDHGIELEIDETDLGEPESAIDLIRREWEIVGTTELGATVRLDATELDHGVTQLFLRVRTDCLPIEGDESAAAVAPA